MRGVGAFAHAGGTCQQAGARGIVILQPVGDGIIKPFAPHKSVAKQFCLPTCAVIDGQAFLQLGNLPAELAVFFAFQHRVQLRHFGIKPRLEHVLPGVHFLFPAAHIHPLSMADRRRRVDIIQQDADDISALDADGDSKFIQTDASFPRGILRQAGYHRVALFNAVCNALPPVVAEADFVLVEPRFVAAFL